MRDTFPEEDSDFDFRPRARPHSIMRYYAHGPDDPPDPPIGIPFFWREVGERVQSFSPLVACPTTSVEEYGRMLDEGDEAAWLKHHTDSLGSGR